MDLVQSGMIKVAAAKKQRRRSLYLRKVLPRYLQLLFQDVINIFYTESRYSFPITEKLGALFAIQFTDQCSRGLIFSKEGSAPTRYNQRAGEL